MTRAAKITAVELGLTAPIGDAKLRARASYYDTVASDADWKKYAIGDEVGIRRSF